MISTLNFVTVYHVLLHMHSLTKLLQASTIYGNCYYYRAVVFISHGVGEHSGRYEHLGTFLKDHKIAVHSHDHRKCC